jgi:hypothetical protein
LRESDEDENSEMPTYEEVEESIQKLKNGRAPDEMTSHRKLLNMDGNNWQKKLHELTCAIWKEEKCLKTGKLVLSALYLKKLINLTAITIEALHYWI